MIQQGQVFKLTAKVPTVSRCGRIGTGLRVAARRGRRSVGSRRALRRRRHCGRCSTGSGREAGARRSRSPSSWTSTWRCIRRRRSRSPSSAGYSAKRPQSSARSGWRICRRGTCTHGGSRCRKGTASKRRRRSARFSTVPSAGASSTAKLGVPNPARRAREKRPFETWRQVEAVAAQLGPVYGPMVIFAAATGLRPSELFGLDRRDVDRQAGVVYVRRAYANGRLKQTKTRLSARAVPLQAKALEALDRLPASGNPILFPNMRGGRIDFRILGRKHWRPAQVKAGIDPVRGLYDLRHTYATFALRAGVPVFAVSRFMGTSIAMIDRHYGHLANDSREHAVALLDALALERAVDAAWTSTRTPRKPIRKTVAASRAHRPRRSVDAWWTPRLVLSPPQTTKGAD